MSSTLKKAAAFAGVLGLSFTVGIAFAAWTANGSGTGYAKAKGKLGLTTAVVTPAGDLYPGSTGAVLVKIVNPNPYPVSIATISKDGTTPLPCSVTFTDQTGLALYVPANGDGTFTLPDAVAMGADAPDSCAGTTIEIPITFAGSSTTPQTTPPSNQPPTLGDTPIVETFSNWTLSGTSTIATWNTTQGLIQSFTRATSGTVTGAAVYVSSVQNGTPMTGATAEVKVWNVNADGTLGTALSTQTLTNLSLSGNSWTLLALPTAVGVGERFAISMMPTWSSTVHLARLSTNPYSGGVLGAGVPPAALSPSSVEDLRMRVYGS